VGDLRPGRAERRAACGRGGEPLQELPAIQFLERAGKMAAVHEQVLAGDEARMHAAKESAGRAELLDGAEALGRVRLRADLLQLRLRLAELLGVEFQVAAQ